MIRVLLPAGSFSLYFQNQFPKRERYNLVDLLANSLIWVGSVDMGFIKQYQPVPHGWHVLGKASTPVQSHLAKRRSRGKNNQTLDQEQLGTIPSLGATTGAVFLSQESWV